MKLFITAFCTSAVLFWGVHPVRATDDAYLQFLRQRANDAIESRDVAKMVECTFALYPVERTYPESEQQFRRLLSTAGELVIGRSNNREIAEFCSSVGPLAELMPPELRTQLDEQSISGMTNEKLDEITVQQAVASSRPVRAIGPGLADPESSQRGSAIRDVADGLGRAALTVVRPSSLASESKPSLMSYDINYPSDHRATLTIKMRWYGCFTNDPYVSTITVHFAVYDDRLEIIAVNYLDNCVFPPPDTRLLTKLVDKLNQLLQ